MQNPWEISLQYGAFLLYCMGDARIAADPKNAVIYLVLKMDTNWHHPHTLPFFHDTPPSQVFYGPLGNIIVKWEVCHFFHVFFAMSNVIVMTG